MSGLMRRREFITLLGGAAAAWPQAARAQQGARVRRIGILGYSNGIDSLFRTRMAALRAGLTKLGWVEDRNLRVEIRHGSFDPDLMRTFAAELIGVGPDLIIATSALATRALQQQTQIIPIVFTAGADPLGNDFVASLARPGGNITGFSNLFPSIASKWVELLKEAVPNLARVALVFDNRNDNGAHRYVVEAEAAGAALGLPTVRILNRNAVEAVHGIDAFAAEPNGGLVLLPPTPNRDTIAQLAAHHRLPAIYSSRENTVEGGLMSYGSDATDIYRRSASYVDRILRGEKPSDLPVQYPTTFELVINLKTAKAIGLTIPEAFLLRADELIE